MEVLTFVTVVNMPDWTRLFAWRGTAPLNGFPSPQSLFQVLRADFKARGEGLRVSKVPNLAKDRVEIGVDIRRALIHLRVHTSRAL